jgi:hypothetical protein
MDEMKTIMNRCVSTFVTSSIPTNNDQVCLTQEKWCVVETCSGLNQPVSQYHLNHEHGSITRRSSLVLNDDNNNRKLFLVPLSALVSTCYVIEDIDYISTHPKFQNYISQARKNQSSTNIYQILPRNDWSEIFLPENRNDSSLASDTNEDNDSNSSEQHISSEHSYVSNELLNDHSNSDEDYDEQEHEDAMMNLTSMMNLTTMMNLTMMMTMMIK